MSTFKKVLALTMALAMLFSVAVFADYTPFSDEDEIDASCLEAVKLLSALNILNGNDNKDGTYSFKPGDAITRAEAVKMIYVLLYGGSDDKAAGYTGTKFTDVPTYGWYYGYVYACVQEGIIDGKSDTIFDPEAPVTGAELAKMLLTVAKYKSDAQGYTGSGWVTNVQKDARNAGLLEGYRLSLTDAAPRQWAALLFYNALMNVEIVNYFGSEVQVGSGLGTGTSIGSRYFGLKMVTGVVQRTENLQLSTNATLLGTKVGTTTDAGGINIPVTDYTDENYNGTTGTYTTSLVDGAVVNYVIDNDYLGQEVMVVYKGNSAATGTVYGVYPTGTSVVYDTSINKVSISSSKVKIGDNTYNIENFKAYNAKMEGFLMQTTVDDVTSSGVTTATTTSAISNLGTKLVSLRATWPARFIDTDGNGVLDMVLVTDSYYGEVERQVAGSSFRVNGKLNAADASNPFKVSASLLNISNSSTTYAYYAGIEKAVVGDIVKITPNFISGSDVYTVEVLSGTNGYFSKYASSAYTVDGASYYNSYNAFTSGTTVVASDNIGSTLYYITDGTYIIATYMAEDTSIASNFAIVMGVAASTSLGFTTNQVNVMLSDGSKAVYTYKTLTSYVDFNLVQVGGVYQYIINTDGTITFRVPTDTNSLVLYKGSTSASDTDKYYYNAVSGVASANTYAGRKVDGAYFFVREKNTSATNADASAGSAVVGGVTVYYYYHYSIVKGSDLAGDIDNTLAVTVPNTAYNVAYAVGGNSNLAFGSLLLEGTLPKTSTAAAQFLLYSSYSREYDEDYGGTYYFVYGTNEKGVSVKLCVGSVAPGLTYGKIYQVTENSGFYTVGAVIDNNGVYTSGSNSYKVVAASIMGYNSAYVTIRDNPYSLAGKPYSYVDLASGNYVTNVIYSSTNNYVTYEDATNPSFASADSYYDSTIPGDVPYVNAILILDNTAGSTNNGKVLYAFVESSGAPITSALGTPYSLTVTP